jgi:E3 ubiquitin-protein ligase BRE1
MYFKQFRKEAIFRRMRHYSRENERSQARITELERLKSTYEASLAVMGACWTQVGRSFPFLQLSALIPVPSWSTQ